MGRELIIRDTRARLVEIPIASKETDYMCRSDFVSKGFRWLPVTFDRLPPVADRYLAGRGRSDLEIWKHNHQVQAILPGATLRLIAEAPFCLRWTRS